MRQAQHILSIEAPAAGLHEITGDIEDWVSGQTAGDGLLTIFIRHSSASILIQENADDAVQRDLETFFANIAPEDMALYSHTSEGPDDMPAHIKGALTQSHLAVPVQRGSMLLGVWQGIFLFEHRRIPRPRQVVLHFAGD